MTRYYRKVFRITADQSPNVQLALAEIANGKPPSNKILVPGVMPYADYIKRRETWDEIRQCIGLDAQFYEGSELLIIPPSWLARSAQEADRLKGQKKREAKAIGIDPGEGSAETCMTVIDELGVLDEDAIPTPDTSRIQGSLIALGRKYNLTPSRWMFDRGGGGKQIADRMRDDGYDVLTVGFGDVVSVGVRRGIALYSDRLDAQEARSAYKNRRAQMYGDLAALIDPTTGDIPFAIPGHMMELHRQLSLIPKRYDHEGKLVLPPKNRRTSNSNEVTMQDILGCSPDRADALVIAVHCMLYGDTRPVAGAMR
jgi:hypothetical protein